MAHTFQTALETWQEARIVQMDFSAAADRVKHQGVLFKLCSVAVGSSLLSILTQFLSNQSQYVVVGGCVIKLVNVVSEVPRESILGLQLFLLYRAELFCKVENKLYGYANDSILIAVIPW